MTPRMVSQDSVAEVDIGQKQEEGQEGGRGAGGSEADGSGSDGEGGGMGREAGGRRGGRTLERLMTGGETVQQGASEGELY